MPSLMWWGKGVVAHVGRVEAFDPDKEQYAGMLDIRAVTGRQGMLETAFGAAGRLTVAGEPMRIFPLHTHGQDQAIAQLPG